MDQKARERLGQILRQVRGSRSQDDLGRAVGVAHASISRIENAVSDPSSGTLGRLAVALNVSADYLLGLTDNPTPADDRTSGPVVVAEAAPLYSPESRHIEVVELAAAAGLGAEVYDETVVSRLAFRQDWLAERGIDAAQCNVIRVAGDSMEPTLPDGCSILVDRSRREPREDQVFVLQTEDGLVVKRLGRDAKGRWQLLSENPAYPPAVLTYGSEIIGEVRWVGRSL